MQLQTISDPAAFLSFEDVVPKSTSNSHVASAALYHCLGTLFLSLFCRLYFLESACYHSLKPAYYCETKTHGTLSGFDSPRNEGSPAS